MKPMSASESESTAAEPGPVHVIVHGKASGFLQEVTAGQHHLQVDEPVSVGGSNAAPDPYDYLLSALGACTSMTVGLYARKKKWPLDEVTVKLRHSHIHAKDCADCETKDGMLDHVALEITLEGALTDEQRATLMKVAQKCPVHRTLTSEIVIEMRIAPVAPPVPPTN